MGLALSCCAGDALMCCAGGAVRCCCCVIPAKRSTATRVLYIVWFAVVMALAISLKFAPMPKYLVDSANTVCGTDSFCWGYLSVERLTFGLVLFHLLLFVLLLGVSAPDDPRAYVQNNLWPIKLALLVGALVGVFFIDDRIYADFWIAALFFSVLFILLQSILLVDFGHAVAEAWLERYEETQSGLYTMLFAVTTTVLYAFVTTATVLMYLWYTQSTGVDQRTYTFVVTMNLFLVVVASVVPFFEKVRERNSRVGLLQSGVVASYITYLVVSAVASDPWGTTKKSSSSFPDDLQKHTSINVALFSQVVGIGLTIVSLGYSAFSTGSQSHKILAVKSDALSDDSDDDGPAYNYPFFHFVMILAAFYMCCVINDWQSLVGSAGGLSLNSSVNAFWVKVATSWVVSLLYVWTLVAPVLFPDRDFS